MSSDFSHVAKSTKTSPLLELGNSHTGSDPRTNTSIIFRTLRHSEFSVTRNVAFVARAPFSTSVYVPSTTALPYAIHAVDHSRDSCDVNTYQTVNELLIT